MPLTISMRLNPTLSTKQSEARRKLAKALLGLATASLCHRAVSSTGGAAGRAENLLFDPRHEFLMMRHADAPGYGDPETMRLDDCASQRNLGDRGRQQAIDTGHWLRQQRLKDLRVWSSPWCRCKDTARLLGFGEPIIKDFLGSFFRDPVRSATQTVTLSAALKSWFDEEPSLALIVVTHQVNMSAYTGRSASSGEIFRIRISSNGQAKSVESMKT
ncbi:MAG: histidine phosphatase family protein [Betaproteobacteria bacterium]|nr:histidine phosphatase family protein [Betaproteobacteria bacterium]